MVESTEVVDIECVGGVEDWYRFSVDLAAGAEEGDGDGGGGNWDGGGDY